VPLKRILNYGQRKGPETGSHHGIGARDVTNGYVIGLEGSYLVPRNIAFDFVIQLPFDVAVCVFGRHQHGIKFQRGFRVKIRVLFINFNAEKTEGHRIWT
jgi:hypothetical protein